MSRKTQRNRPAAPAPVAHAERNVNVLVATVIALFTAFVAGVLYYSVVHKAPAKRSEAQHAALASAGAPSLGPADAPVHIVEFLDPACETCAMFYPYVKRMMADNPGRIRLSVRHVAFHKGADTAVRALEAARAQGRYWEALEALLDNQGRWVQDHRVMPEQVVPALASAGLDEARLKSDMESLETSARIGRDLSDAVTLGVARTPEYFVNGRQMKEFGLDELHALVGEELRATSRVAAR
jgi:protein-disulfide isomerase